MDMEAIIITTPGNADVLQLAKRDIPQPADNEVLIRVAAAGINRPDIAQRKGNYPPPEGAPQDIPGLEVAGVIEACGKNIKRWQPGQEVCALLAGGGYSSYVTAHESLCLSKPSSLSFAEAASLPETVFTVWHNVFQRGHLQKGEHFLVHGGSSGVGIAAIQLAKSFGAKVFTTAGTAEKCEACINLGADICINYKKDDFELLLINEGVDVILDMIGGDYTAKNINILNTDGRLMYINAMNGARVYINIMDLMKQRLIISGSTLRSREISFKAQLAGEVEKHVWPLIEDGKFKPVVYKTFPLKNAAEAHRLMESSSHIGKIVLKVID
jgi:NADPH2:quinone reductase